MSARRATVLWHRLALLLAALWWGSLTALGLLVVPAVFAHFPSPAQAGRLAAQLFTGQWWLSLACCLPLLLVFSKNRLGASTHWSHNAMFTVVAGIWLAALVEFVAAPKILARENLRLWHSLATAGLALQWLSAAWLLWRWPDAGAAPSTGQGGQPD